MFIVIENRSLDQARVLVCLANSRKQSGRCVAGKLLDGSGRWIRPISARENHEVSLDERRYDNGEEPALRDVVNLCVVEHRAHTYQGENWLLDDRYYWTKARSLKWKQLAALEDAPDRLWINGQHTLHGHNDQIALEQTNQLANSLRLIRVPEFVIRVFRPGAKYGDNKRKVQGKFKYLGTSYHLRVTDPLIEKKFLALGDGAYTLPTSYLTISLGDPHHGKAYKLIAAVMTMPGGEVFDDV